MAARRDRTLVVTFHKLDGPSPSAWWEAVRPTRGRVRGGHMPIGRGRIPHDLGHMATEAHFGIRDGFWGLLARGATYDHGTQQRRTRPGRQLVRENRAGLQAAEHLGNHHHAAWSNGQATPVASTFDRLAALWDEVPDGGTLTVQWPSLETTRTASTTEAFGAGEIRRASTHRGTSRARFPKAADEQQLIAAI